MKSGTAIILVGHGGAPTDYPREKLQRLKRLEAERMARRQAQMSDEESALDREIRGWPRTPATDAYKFGLEEIAHALEKRSGRRVLAAYNEFCGPSLEEAVARLADDGNSEIRIATTMFTRGGVHSECEIPFGVKQLREKFPAIRIDYAWPFDTAMTADFLHRHLEAR